MKTKEQILEEIFQATGEDELQLAITLNPSLEHIVKAMEEYAEQAFNAAREEQNIGGPFYKRPSVYPTFESFLNSIKG